MVQACWDGWISLGIHIDWRSRRTASGQRYGPYVDMHLLCVIVSIGVNPVYSGEIDTVSSVSRGGLRAEDH